MAAYNQFDAHQDPDSAYAAVVSKWGAVIIKNKSAWSSSGVQDHKPPSGGRITLIGLLKATRSTIKIYFSHLKYSKFSCRNFCFSDERYLFTGIFKVEALLFDYASSHRIKSSLIDNGLLCL